MVRAPVSGQGTWQTTLQGRLETAPGSGVFLAYYDTVLDITWAADANINGQGTWDNQVAWAAGVTIGGVSGWRLPTVSPIDGSTLDITFSNNATTDFGYAPTTTDGTDGGWRDGGNTPVSEMGHMYYVTLGNLGLCTPDNGNPSGCTEQTGWGLTNTGPFSNVQSFFYWSGTEFGSDGARSFLFLDGFQNDKGKEHSLFAWAVRSGDVREIEVAIDIEPGNKRKVINPRAKGGIWVAILSDTDPETPFDPSSQVDIPTVEFGPDGAKAKRHKVKDINKDGLGDLLLRFKIRKTGIACGDTEATLTGQTFDGVPVTGTDSIKTVGCEKK